MNARPIPFSAPMIRALLEGRKSQTRRMIKAKEVFISASGAVMDMADGHIKEVKFPYGEQGGYLWVKETWQFSNWTEDGCPYITYRADNKEMLRDRLPSDEVSEKLFDIWEVLSDEDNYNIDGRAADRKWRSSIYMPRWASRLTLKMTELRVERLQDISEADAIAEGIEQEDGHWKDYLDGDSSYATSPIFSYKSLWESINGEGSWDLNPFVWCLDFTVINKNIDEVLRDSAH